MKNPYDNYSDGERKAEAELDQFLRRVNDPSPIDVLKQLRELNKRLR